MAPLSHAPPQPEIVLWKAYKNSQVSKHQPQSKVLNAENNDFGKDWKNGSLDYWDLKEDDSLGATLKYTLDCFGPQPNDGYPLYIGLHGGGGTDRESNNRSWFYMATRNYGSALKTQIPSGVYVATRGVSTLGGVDTWDLHFRPQSYVLLQRLIRNLILPNPPEANQLTKNSKALTFINPNKVFILGFSAGGDGVYRLSEVLSDRFAAANMSAGHPGATKFINLANIPISLQVGEEDGNLPGQYARNQWTVKAGQKLMRYRENDRNNYEHAVFIHPTKQLMIDALEKWDKNEKTKPNAHNIWKKQEWKDQEFNIFDQWGDWVTGPASNGDVFHVPESYNRTSLFNTCATMWVTRKNINDKKSARERNPVPSLVIWDISTRAPEGEPLIPTDWKQYRFRYWLAVLRSFTGDDQVAKDAGNYVVRVSYTRDQKENSLWIEQTPTSLLILLNSAMLDLKRPVTVYYGSPWARREVIAIISVKQDLNIQKATLIARGDPKLIFSAAVTFDPKLKTAVNAPSDTFSNFFESVPAKPKL